MRSLPASIFEKSRMSLTIESSASAEVVISRASSRWSGSRSVAASISAIDITPFIGVRISWLMFARNSLFARAASSASSRARRSSASAALRRPMSRSEMQPHSPMPPIAGSAETPISRSTPPPSLRRARASTCASPPPPGATAPAASRAASGTIVASCSLSSSPGP